MVGSITIRPFRKDDLTFADQVRALAGWNQTARDWHRLLEYQPDGCFLAAYDGRPAGTATAICYDDVLGWIGMVLVHPELRRRGIATALMRQCMEFLVPRVGCIKLDATPAGQGVYERLGFAAEYTLTRWQQTARRPPRRAPTDSATIAPADWHDIIALDNRAFGTDRARWLRLLARDSHTVRIARAAQSKVMAYGMARTGARAAYLGPIAATETAAAESMVRELLDNVPQNDVYWDIPDGNRAAVALAEQLGFTRQRPLLRMWHGTRSITGLPQSQWAIAGPSVG